MTEHSEKELTYGERIVEWALAAEKPMYSTYGSNGHINKPLEKNNMMLGFNDMGIGTLNMFCLLRNMADAGFVPLFERALELAKADKSKKYQSKEDKSRNNLVQELLASWGADCGYNPKTGERLIPSGNKSDRYFDAMGNIPEDNGYSTFYPFAAKDDLYITMSRIFGAKRIRESALGDFQLYPFTDKDQLPTLLGMLIGAAQITAYENKRIVGVLRKEFPDKFPATGSTDQFAEYSVPDEIMKSPYIIGDMREGARNRIDTLVRGMIGGVDDVMSNEERKKITDGIWRIYAAHDEFYNKIQQKINAYVAKTPESQGRGR